MANEDAINGFFWGGKGDEKKGIYVSFLFTNKKKRDV